MDLSSPFCQWDLRTQKLCIENMRFASRPINWAIRRISCHQHPQSKIYSLIIQLLRRLNLPLIYLVSETTLMACVICALWAKAKQIFRKSAYRFPKFDQNSAFTVLQFGQMMGSLICRRVELILEIIRQMLFGAVDIQTHSKDHPPQTPAQAFTRRSNRNCTKRIDFLPKDRALRAKKLFGAINHFANEKTKAFSSPLSPQESSSNQDVLNDLTCAPKCQKFFACRARDFNSSLTREKCPNNLNFDDNYHKKNAPFAAAAIDGGGRDLSLQPTQKTLKLTERNQKLSPSSQSPQSVMTFALSGEKITHSTQSISTMSKASQVHESSEKIANSLNLKRQDSLKIATPERLNEPRIIYRASPEVKSCALDFPKSRHQRSDLLKKKNALNG